MALGALPSDVLSLVGKLGLRLTLIGVAIGILLAVGLTRLIARFLVDVKPTGPGHLCGRVHCACRGRCVVGLLYPRTPGYEG